MLAFPIERESGRFLKQSARGQFRRLDAVDDLLDDIGSKKCQANSKGPATPLGNARSRKSLFMVVLQLVRRNPWLRQYYERLRAAGKPGKVAIIAAMRKLLTAVWSVATHRRPFVPTMSALPATKNA